MARLLWRGLTVFLLVVILLLSRSSGQLVVLGDFFNFSTTPQPQCSPGAELKLLRLLLNGTEVPVASRDDSGSWTASASYTDRLQLSDSSLVLTNTNYNDNGLYEFTCGGDGTRIQMNVVVPIRFSVFENETVTLPCHAVTVGGEVKLVRWETKKKSKKVARMSVTSNKVVLEDEFKSRVSVPTDWFSTGDFTLTLGPVQLQDQGDYICYVQDKPVVVARLTVQETRNETSTKQAGPGHANEESGHTTCVGVVTLVLCAVAFGIMIGIRIGWWMRSRRSPPPPPPPPPRPQPEGAQVAVPLVSQYEPGLQTNGLALNGHG